MFCNTMIFTRQGDFQSQSKSNWLHISKKYSGGRNGMY
jgi:hypothetical protein